MVWIMINVAIVSTIGWLLSLLYRRSSARRHLILLTALFACALLPIAAIVRQETEWTLFAIRTIPGQDIPEINNALATGDTPGKRDPELNESTRAIHPTDTATAQNQRSNDIAENETAKNELPNTELHAAKADASPIEERVSRRSTTGAGRGFWLDWKQGLAIAYSVVAGCMTLRLLAELLTLQWLRRRAITIDELAGGTTVSEANVLVPIAAGFGKPTVILPCGFSRAFAGDKLRDVLAHENEHLRRRDHWVMLLQGVVAALYWPIISIHFLNRLLNRAREELCDNAVLAQREPAAYAETLLAVAENLSRRHAFAEQLPPSITPSIMGRGELEQRVCSLLDSRRDPRTRVSRWVRCTAAVFLMSSVAFLGTTRVVAVTPERPTQKPASPSADGADDTPQSKPPNPKDDIEWTKVPTVDLEDATMHRGIVLGPDGMPLPGAAVYAASTIELFDLTDAADVSVKDLGTVRAVTDAKGRFEFVAKDLTWITSSLERKRWETILVATKDGLAPGWLKTWGADRSFRSHWHPSQSREVLLRVRPKATLTGQFFIEKDKPLVGARIRLKGLMAPTDYDLEKHVNLREKKALGLFQSISYAESINRPWILPKLGVEVTTDGDGRFELPGMPEGFIASLEITHRDSVTTRIRAAIRPIEPVYRKPDALNPNGTPLLTLYGSGFKATMAKGVILRGKVTGYQQNSVGAGVLVALSNHNAQDGMYGQRFKTDADGRFELTGLSSQPQAYEVAFAGSFDAPFGSRRQKIVPGEDADVKLAQAVRYRLKLLDRAGMPVEREVSSDIVQTIPGLVRRDIKSRFNDAVRVAPGVYEGIVPIGPGVVLVKRGAKADRPAAVDPKAFFAPKRTDWTVAEERYSFGDAWRIARQAVVTTEALSVAKNQVHDQLDFAAIIFTKANASDGLLELTATVNSDPPVVVALVDEDGETVRGTSIDRQLKRYNGKDLPATLSVYGLHPKREEFLLFRHEERGLIGTISTTWTDQRLRVVMRPAAKLVGRFVDESGDVNFDFGVRVKGMGVPPDTFVAGRRNQTREEPGRRMGEFQLVVPPGIALRGEFIRKAIDRTTRPPAGVAFGPLIPKPGETLDLGDLSVP